MAYPTGIAEALNKYAPQFGTTPLDLGTVISYETGGTFDPWQRGPTTQWGQHRGLIQMGEPQRQKYGYAQDGTIDSQFEAIGKYLKASGFKPGMNRLDLYSTINAGAPGKYNASDAGNGGAPGTVADKVRDQMGAHAEKAAALLGTPSLSATGGVPQGDMAKTDVPSMSSEPPPQTPQSAPPASLFAALTGDGSKDSTGGILGALGQIAGSAPAPPPMQMKPMQAPQGPTLADILKNFAPGGFA